MSNPLDRVATRMLDEAYGGPWRFFAAGAPQTKGSARAFMPKGARHPVVTNDNPKAKAWQGVVAHAAHAAGLVRLDGPVRVEMTFCLARPKSHYGSGRNSERLRSDAPAFPSSKPDIDKCGRVVLDSLTGVAYSDDGQVSFMVASKVWAERGESVGVEVRVSRAGPQQVPPVVAEGSADE